MGADTDGVAVVLAAQQMNKRAQQQRLYTVDLTVTDAAL
jgi:hypothetical protein